MLGPSGCGKTTTLRMIAGFEAPDAGRILLQGNDVTYVPPAKRNVNMVFQAYGLFPHMTVAENIAFGPKIKKLGRTEIATRLQDVIRTVQLDGLEDRRPNQLSGGQQQRVALARALVNRPAALLLDEPLGALDLKLRKEMQLELKELQQRTGTTFVYVTHDQEEAMTMSDRIAVMNGGVVEQLATPRELYQRPASAFVAGFIGTSNLIELRVDRRDDAVFDDGPRQRTADPRRGSGRRTARGRSDDHRAARVDQARERRGGRPRVLRGRDGDRRRLPRIDHAADRAAPDGRATDRAPTERRGRCRPSPRPGEPVMLRWAADHSYIVGSAPDAERARSLRARRGRDVPMATRSAR